MDEKKNFRGLIGALDPIEIAETGARIQRRVFLGVACLLFFFLIAGEVFKAPPPSGLAQHTSWSLFFFAPAWAALPAFIPGHFRKYWVSVSSVPIMIALFMNNGGGGVNSFREIVLLIALIGVSILLALPYAMGVIAIAVSRAVRKTARE
ncbi:MAG: hypothetical protein R3C60_15090 [Parvularculaceae bacterium]